MPVEWGGKDDYVYSFEPEVRQNDELKDEKGTSHRPINNNKGEETNLNLLHRKVS